MTLRKLSVDIEVNCTQTKCSECHFQHPECSQCILFDETLTRQQVFDGSLGGTLASQRLKSCAVAEWKAKKPQFPDISDLSPELQAATVEVVAAIAAVIRAHQNDPERGDVGWRRQDAWEHVAHASDHTNEAYERWDSVPKNEFGQPLDDDNLPHEDHALCRLMLAKARRRLG